MDLALVQGPVHKIKMQFKMYMMMEILKLQLQKSTNIYRHIFFLIPDKHLYSVHSLWVFEGVFLCVHIGSVCLLTVMVTDESQGHNEWPAFCREFSLCVANIRGGKKRAGCDMLNNSCFHLHTLTHLHSTHRNVYVYLTVQMVSVKSCESMCKYGHLKFKVKKNMFFLTFNKALIVHFMI